MSDTQKAEALRLMKEDEDINFDDLAQMLSEKWGIPVTRVELFSIQVDALMG